MAGDDRALATEHGVLLRHWAGLQARVSRQCEAQRRRCAELEAEVMRWRARWMVATTQLAWGLGWPRLAPERIRAAVSEEPRLPPGSAAQVICQTGCAGHAHPWRDDAGQCGLTGAACERVPPTEHTLQR